MVGLFFIQGGTLPPGAPVVPVVPVLPVCGAVGMVGGLATLFCCGAPPGFIHGADPPVGLPPMTGGTGGLIGGTGCDCC